MSNMILSFLKFFYYFISVKGTEPMTKDRKIGQMWTTVRRTIAGFQAGKRRASASNSKPAVVHSQLEMDLHADTIVCGSNCVIMHYTGKECDVSPYTDAYNAIKSVPIVQAATAYNNPETGVTSILVLNEAIWMGDQMRHTLVNPNQLRAFGVTVQDNPFVQAPLYMSTEGNEFTIR